MTRREKVHAKYNGLCAYTGKPLGDDWQIDHLEPLVRDAWDMTCESEKAHVRKLSGIDNMLPACRIINHYKHSYHVEFFRRMIATLQSRIDKFPRWCASSELGESQMSPNQKKTLARYRYVTQVAALFGITKETPFSGKFYYEAENEQKIGQ